MKFFDRQGWGRALLLIAMMMIGTQTALAQAQRQQNYTGNGGKGISLTIYVPQSTGLTEKQSYIPALVQGEFVSNFSNYSAISILDWERLDDIYVKLVNEAYDDKAEAKQDAVLGRLAPTSHFLTGNIIKTEIGYNIKMNITATADKMTVATYSGTFSFAELDNLTGIRRAALELLQNVGVELTEKARQELAGAAEANQILAQTALAKGVTAQRAGTEIAALSYYYQAASFNPALKEAVKRSTVVAANIKSGNLGADIRNDILWRKNWMARLKETEEAYYAMIGAADPPPFTLTYFTDIKTENVNYQTETADLSIITYLDANGAWFAAMDQALEAARSVLDGLDATNKKKDWELEKWPGIGVSETNPFYRPRKYKINVVFELVNQHGKVIGSQIIELNPGFRIGLNCANYKCWRISAFVEDIGFGSVNFKGVKAIDISDNLTIRVASVNGAPPQNVRFSITAAAGRYFGTITDRRDGKTYKTVVIGGKRWMAENLNYKPQTGNSWCLFNENSYCDDQYGRLYDWNTAKTVCMAGWRLPSTQEWRVLVTVAGGETDGGGNNLKSKEKSSMKIDDKSKHGWSSTGTSYNGNAKDIFGFSALPGGARGTKGAFDGPRDYNGIFPYLGHLGFWWAVTEHSNADALVLGIRDGFYDNGAAGFSGDGIVSIAARPKSFGFSVRCVADNVR